MTSHTVKSTIALVSLSLLALTGCGADSGNTTNSSEAAASSSKANSTSLTVEAQWAKAADSGMTAVFGKITNNGSEAVKIIGVSTTASDDAQLHTTELDSSGTSTMKQTESFTIEPGDSLTLEPGGDHIMVMDMKCSLPAGSTITATLKTESGEEINFDAEARDYSGAKEEYAPGEEGTSSAEPTSAVKDHTGHTMHADEQATSSESAGSMDMDMSSASALPQCAQ